MSLGKNHPNFRVSAMTLIFSHEYASLAELFIIPSIMYIDGHKSKPAISILVVSKNRPKEPGHSGYFSPVLRKMYITLILFQKLTSICIYFYAYCCLSNDPTVFKNCSVQSSLLTNYSDKTQLFSRKRHFVVPKTPRYTDKNMCLT